MTASGKNRSNGSKSENSGDPCLITQGDKRSERGPTARRKRGGLSRSAGGRDSAVVAEAQGKQEAVFGDDVSGDEKCGGQRMVSLGDLPSLGKKMVSHKVCTQMAR